MSIKPKRRNTMYQVWQPTLSTCGPTSLRMVLDYFEIPHRWCEIYYDTFQNGATTTQKNMKAAIEKYGLTYDEVRATDTLKASIETDDVHILFCKAEGGDHWVVCKNTANGVRLYNPGSSNWTEEKGKEVYNPKTYFDDNFYESKVINKEYNLKWKNFGLRIHK
ncbi:MAG: hypothetical protein HQK98_07385 [Nitrospirae bacterium]|nr:hypothetical protein [Nitrospirota bacterium]